MNALRDIGSALRLLTVVPLPGREGAHPVRYFGLVGWLYAAVAVGAASAAVSLGRADGPGALLTGVLIVGAWAGLSGFLHWDGLADSADGLGARGDAERRLAVMRESGIGAFGAVAVVLTFAAQVTAVAMIVESRAWWALGAAPVIGRVAAAVALTWRRAARSDGLGARYAGGRGALDLALLAVTLIPLVIAGPAAARVIGAALGLAIGIVLPGVFTRRIGGMTGDIAGATILLTEAAILVGGALAGPLV